MSWWIIDTVSINEDGDESLCDIQCDTAADLPAADQTGTAGYTIVRGSTALDLATGDRYIMDSSGSWVRQPSQYQLDLSGYATQSWVNGELAGYVQLTTYTTDKAALETEIGEVVDEGAKNRFLYDKDVGTTETIHGRTFTIQSDGGVKIETTGAVDADADFYVLGVWSNRNTLFDAMGKEWIPVCNCEMLSDFISLRIYNRSTGSTVASRTVTTNDNAGNSFDFDLTCAFIKIGSAQTIPSGGIVVYPMICTAHDWAVSQKFVPYAPTNRELYEMILALQ